MIMLCDDVVLCLVPAVDGGSDCMMCKGAGGISMVKKFVTQKQQLQWRHVSNT